MSEHLDGGTPEDTEDYGDITREARAALEWAAARRGGLPAWDTPEAHARVAEKLDAIQANTPEQNDALLREELVTGADAAEFETAVRAETFKLKVREEAQRRHSGIAKAELTLVSEADILARPAPDWWIDGLLQKGTVAVFAGEAGIGKSFMSLHMARCIATGQRFFYRDTSKGTVLYVVAEGASAFGKRARAWDSANYTTPPEGSMNYLESGVNLSDPESVQRLGALLDDLQPDIVILDTLSQLGGVENENDAGQLSKVFRTAKELRDHKEGSTVILVHHVNKSSGGVRGSSVIRANADTVIVAKSSKGGFCLSTEVSDDGKQKDGAPLKLEGFYLDDHAGSAVVRQANTVESDTDWNIVRDLLADASAKSKADLRIACGIPKATATDSAYKAWSRKWKRWTAADGPLIVSADGKTVTLAGITTPTAEAA